MNKDEQIREMFDKKTKRIAKAVALENAIRFVNKMSELGKLNGKDYENVLITVLNVAKEFEKFLTEGQA